MTPKEPKSAEATPEPAAPRPAAPEPAAPADEKGTPWARVKNLVVHKILRLDDTPHRIAWGVFWGFVVGATPTLGLQMIIYFMIAAVVRCNKISGIPPIWLSNPVTAVPLYYSNWKIGRFLMSGNFESSPETKAAIQAIVADADKSVSWREMLFSTDFWKAAFGVFVDMGLELWIGSLFVGVIFGVLGYWAAFRGVVSYRKLRGKGDVTDEGK